MSVPLTLVVRGNGGSNVVWKFPRLGFPEIKIG